MHDCPKCQIPLHGHESFCPICGQKQQVRPENQTTLAQQFKKSTNPVWLVLIALLMGGLLFYALENSWVGALIRRGPVVEVQDNAVTQLAAREKLENAVMQNLASQSSTGKFKYMCADKVVDKNCPQAVEVTIETNLRQPSRRKEIVEPVKSLMVPAHINTITLNDERSHATVTYSMAPSSGAGTDASDDGSSKPANSDNTQQ